jgi:hypothetical protein
LPQAKDPIDKTVKSFPSLLVCTATILGVGAAFNSLLAEERAFPAKFPIRQVVVVIRHGEDAKSRVAPDKDGGPNDWLSAGWKEVSNYNGVMSWPSYTHHFFLIGPDGEAGPEGDTNIKVVAHGLSGDWEKDGISGKVEGKVQGEKQALTLGKSLDGFLDSHNFARIGRAITMDPRRDNEVQNDPTPNPFDTLWPYLHDKPNVELYLVKLKNNDPVDLPDGIKNLIDAESEKVLPSVGSSIICWTGEGLSGTDGVLARLYKKYNIATDEDAFAKGGYSKGQIGKCYNVFIFYWGDGKGVVEKGIFDCEAENPWKFE